MLFYILPFSQVILHVFSDYVLLFFGIEELERQFITVTKH
jgi:hypothetical protein